MKFHPAAIILAWCLLIVLMQVLHPYALLVTAGSILLFAVIFSRQKFIQLLRRTRWIMLSLLLVFSYSTPGIPLFDSFGMFSPSHEGMEDGLLQLTRLLATLASLAMVLDRLHRQQVMAGLYTLLAPLLWLGLSRERIAVRLALTLHYAEVAMLRETNIWQEDLRSLFDHQGGEDYRSQMELSVCRFTVRDALLLVSALILLVVAMR